MKKTSLYKSISPKPKKLKDKMGFGKYKSHTVEEIILIDPQYLKWTIDENIVLYSNIAYKKIIYACEIAGDTSA